MHISYNNFRGSGLSWSLQLRIPALGWSRGWSHEMDCWDKKGLGAVSGGGCSKDQPPAKDRTAGVGPHANCGDKQSVTIPQRA